MFQRFPLCIWLFLDDRAGSAPSSPLWNWKILICVNHSRGLASCFMFLRGAWFLCNLSFCCRTLCSYLVYAMQCLQEYIKRYAAIFYMYILMCLRIKLMLCLQMVCNWRCTWYNCGELRYRFLFHTSTSALSLICFPYSLSIIYLLVDSFHTKFTVN